MTTSYNKDDLESVLRYLTGEYGVEILAGQGSIPGRHDIMRLLPDFFSTKHKGDYSMMSMMVREGIMTKLLSLRESGISGDECRRLVAIETQKLTDNFIPQEIAAKYVNMIAEIMGLKVPAVMVKAAPTPKTQPAAKPKSQPAAKPKRKRPTMSDDEFVELCKFGTARKVEEALENGANVNARDNEVDYEGMTALCIASDWEYVELVEVLLKYGADVNAKDDYEYTALMYAACDRNDDDSNGSAKQAILEALLRHGADINAKNGEGGSTGSTALHLAVQNGRLAAVKVLLKHGANVNIKNNYGKTPLDCVPYGKDAPGLEIKDWLAPEIIDEIADALRNPKRYADTGRNSVNDYDFLELCESGTARGVEEALRHGANINARNDFGWTALYLAALHQHADVVEVLLRHGANVNARNYEGKTALHEAASWGKANVAELLLKHGADPNARDKSGRTALDVAQQEGQSDVVELQRSKDTRSFWARLFS